MNVVMLPPLNGRSSPRTWQKYSSVASPTA